MKRGEITRLLASVDLNKFESFVLQQVPELQSLLVEAQGGNRIDIRTNLCFYWADGVMYGILKLMEDPEKNKEILQRVFRLIEVLLGEKEVIQSVVRGATFGEFYRREELRQIAQPLMGQKTKRMWEEYIEKQTAFALWQLSQMGGAE